MRTPPNPVKLSDDAPRLLVPVQLNALVAGKNANKTTWAAVTPQYDFIALLYITLGDKLLPPTFTSAMTPRPGVHLHWTLPDALTHGQQGQARAIAILNATGGVEKLSVVDGGFGYVDAPAVSFDGGGGTGAVATATVKNGVVTGITVTSAGAGYRAAPTVLIGSSSVIRYPALPNRWFVLRTHIDDATKKVALKSWIVESDALYMESGRQVIARLPSHTEPLLRAGTLQGDIENTLLSELGIRIGPETRLVPSNQRDQWYLFVNRSQVLTIFRHEDAFLVSADKSITWPTLDNEDTPFMYLGLSYDYEKGNKTPVTGRADLTSIGPGDPQFTAFYPNCRSVFGFHDALEDLPGGGKLNYLVTGYYDDPKKDPLYGYNTAALWTARMAELEWCLAQDPGGYPVETVCGLEEIGTTSAAPPPFPTSTLCHAMTYGIDWRGPNAEYTSAVPAGQPKLAMGNTSTEALSALIASMVPPPAGEIGIEEILEAFQYDLLDRLQEPDGVIELELALHQNAFGSRSGGTLWQVRGKHVDEHDSEDHPFDPVVGQLLTDLNKLQQSYDESFASLRSLQWQTYSAWYKKILLNLSPFQSAPPQSASLELPGFRGTPGNIMQHRWELPESLRGPELTAAAPITVKQIIEVLTRLEAQIADAKIALAALKTRLDSTRLALLTALAAKMPEYELVEAAQPRFWIANDPAVLFAGDGVSRAFQRGESTLLADGQRLPCRVTGQTIWGLTVTPKGYPAQTVTDAQLKQFYGAFPTGGPIPAEIPSLFVETLLLATTMDRLLALAAFQLAGVPNPSEPQIAELAGTIRTIQTAPWNAALHRAKRSQLPGFTTQRIAAAVGLDGTLPYKISVGPWSQPWIPLLLQWSVQWLPSYATPSEVGFCNPLESGCDQKWIFNEVDYQWNTKFSPVGTPQANSVYGGTTLLAPHAPDNLKKRIEDYVLANPGTPFKKELLEIAAALGTVNVLSQNLGGLGASMQQQLQTLQLPVIDLFNQNVGEQVAAAIDGNNEVATLPEAKYNPIRSGHFNILNLWIVDAFGQAKKIVGQGLPYEPILARTISTEGADYKKLAQMPARVSQASRLDFQWLMASNDARPTNSDPATSPLCGWVLPNYFDQSIAVYEADGKSAGSLQLLAGGLGKGGSGLRWVQPPGVNTPVGTPPSLGNAHLQSFVDTLLDYGAHGKDALTDLLQAFEAAASTTAIAGGRQAGGAALLFGRPLAVMRASARWLIEGLPAYDQTWAALKYLYDTRKFETRGFTGVKFPLRLGDIRQIRDGTVGYFLGTQAETDYRTFYATLLEPTAEQRSDYIRYGKLIQLTCDPAAPPVMLTILVDPRAPIHLTTDALPARAIEIPPFQIQQALKAMDITFRAGPLIEDQLGLSIPLPSGVHGKWTWFYQPDVVTWKDDPKIEPSTAVAEFPAAPRHLNEGWLKLSEALGDAALRAARAKREKS
jgi:hypothetical protein